MAKGSNAGRLRSVRQKGVTGLAWASFVIAVVGGALVADTFLGNAVEWTLEKLPWQWVPPVLLFAAVVAVGLDLFLDGVPNQVAIYGALAAPSVATAAPGKLGDKVGEWSGAVLGYLDGELVSWLGTNSSTGLAIACIAGSLLMARRVVKKSAGVPAGA